MSPPRLLAPSLGTRQNGRCCSPAAPLLPALLLPRVDPRANSVSLAFIPTGSFSRAFLPSVAFIVAFAVPARPMLAPANIRLTGVGIDFGFVFFRSGNNIHAFQIRMNQMIAMTVGTLLALGFSALFFQLCHCVAPLVVMLAAVVGAAAVVLTWLPLLDICQSRVLGLIYSVLLPRRHAFQAFARALQQIEELLEIVNLTHFRW